MGSTDSNKFNLDDIDTILGEVISDVGNNSGSSGDRILSDDRSGIHRSDNLGDIGNSRGTTGEETLGFGSGEDSDSEGDSGERTNGEAVEGISGVQGYASGEREVTNDVRGDSRNSNSFSTSDSPSVQRINVDSDSSGQSETSGSETRFTGPETNSTDGSYSGGTSGDKGSGEIPGSGRGEFPSEDTEFRGGEEGTGRNSEEESTGDNKTNSKYGETDLPELPRGITEETIKRVVSSAWLSHLMDGTVNEEFVRQNLPKNLALPKGWTLGKVLLLPHVGVQLEARGIPKPTEMNILTPKQIQALVAITSSRGSKWNTRLRQAGVTNAEWASWMKQPNFRSVYDRYAEGKLKDAVSEGINALSDNAADGDINSIRLVLEMTGRHNPNGEKEINIQAILIGIVEILQQEIADGEVLMRVVNRIKSLQTGTEIGSKRARPVNGLELE